MANNPYLDPNVIGWQNMTCDYVGYDRIGWVSDGNCGMFDDFFTTRRHVQHVNSVASRLRVYSSIARLRIIKKIIYILICLDLNEY